MGMGIELGMGMELGMGVELGMGMGIRIGVYIAGHGTGLTINARPARRRPLPIASATIESSAPNGAANCGAGAGRRQSKLNRR